MKAYYAHCQSLYDTAQEERDVVTLHRLGFDVVSPNSTETHLACEKIKAESKLTDPRDEVMAYFYKFAKECDCIAFRALPDGSISSGVYLEITMFQSEGKPVFEIPSGLQRRGLGLEQTREYMREVGYR